MNIKQKQQIIIQALQTTHYINFDAERGLVPEKVGNMNFNSVIDENTNS